MKKTRTKSFIITVMALMLVGAIATCAWAYCMHVHSTSTRFTSYSWATDSIHTKSESLHRVCYDCGLDYTESMTEGELHSFTTSSQFMGHTGPSNNGNDAYRVTQACSVCGGSITMNTTVPCHGGSTCGQLSINSIPDIPEHTD